MLNYLPKYFTLKSISLYIAVLVLVNMLFFFRILPFVWWVFGLVEVVSFFYFSNILTRQWANKSPKTITKKIFTTALIIRLGWVVFSYFFFYMMTGDYFGLSEGDANYYHELSKASSNIPDYSTIWNSIYKTQDGTLSDTGYLLYLITFYKFFGYEIIVPRLFKALFGAYICVLIYKLATRNFGENVGRMAGIFCMLMPNLIYYSGTHLKEVEMVLLTVWFIERADFLFRSKNITIINLLFPLLLAGSLFFLRTALGAIALFSLIATLAFLSKRILSMGKRILFIGFVSATLTFFIGSNLAKEVDTIWKGRHGNQEKSYEWRSQRTGGNKFAKYITGTLVAPLIVTIPFPTMVNVQGQENQQLIHGGNYIKNILSFFIFIAFFWIIKEKKWREHVLIISFTLGYLVAIASSAYAQSERFHQPALPFLMVFAALGVSKITNKNKRYFIWFLVFVFIAIVGWNWFKLAGRGMV